MTAKEKNEWIAREISWCVRNAIIDNENENLDYLTIKQILIVQNIVRDEVQAFLNNTKKETFNEIKIL